MSKFPQTPKPTDRSPAWFQAARAFYGDAFEPKKKSDLVEAMSDWCEMDADERGFVLAHLQYLNLLAARGTQRMLRELRALVAELGDEVVEGLDGLADVVDPEDDVDEVIDDDAGDDQQPEGRHLELVEDTPIPDYEPEPRKMPVEAVAPELLRDADEERVVELPGIDGEVVDVEPPEGA